MRTKTGPKFWKIPKLSFLQKSILSAFVLFFLTDLAMNIYSISETSHENTKFLRGAYETVQEAAKSMLAANQIKQACSFLQTSLDRKLVAFYIIQDFAKSKEICLGPIEYASRINLRYNDFDHIIEKPDFDLILQSTKQANLVMTIASVNDTWAVRRAQFLQRLGHMAIYFLISIFATFLLLRFLDKPLQHLMSNLKSKGWVDTKDQGDRLTRAASYREVEMFSRASEEAHRSIEDLREKLRYSAEDLSVELRRRAQEGNLEIPFHLRAAITRIDINGFTKMSMEDPKTVVEVVRLIAANHDELLHRYGGFHNTFVGDELVSAFLHQDSKESLRLGLALIRDTFHVMEQAFPSEKIPKTVTAKASFAEGDSVVFELPFGLKIRGFHLIQSARLLEHVSTKATNRLVLQASDAGLVALLAKSGEPVEVQLTTNNTQNRICEINEFLSLRKSLDRENLEGLSYFRADQHIIELLQELPQAQPTQDEKLKILAHLKSFRVCQTVPEVFQAWIDCFTKLDQEVVENRFLLSGLLMAGRSLLPLRQWTNAYTEALMKAKCLKDSRCRGSIAQLLSEKITSSEFAKHAEKLAIKTDGSYRPIGDVLVGQGGHELSDRLFKKLLSMLRSKNPFEAATGIYASAEIISLYRKKDPVVLSQYNGAEKLIKEIELLCKHSDAMVRTRAEKERYRLHQEVGRAV